MPDSFDAAISRLAHRQHRNITREQLLALGISDYTVGTPALTPHERAYAAILACGPTALLSHEPAMVLHAIWRRWPGRLEVTITRGDRRPRDITVHRSRTLTQRDIDRQYGIR
ncbi:MAG TPA: hypothetical protein VMD48_05925 [Solirubrobacteraceae bacterium]|nr:hypothetical protein [Solirubrobacteraceae bacterium]